MHGSPSLVCLINLFYNPTLLLFVRVLDCQNLHITLVGGVLFFCISDYFVSLCKCLLSPSCRLVKTATSNCRASVAFAGRRNGSID